MSTIKRGADDAAKGDRAERWIAVLVAAAMTTRNTRPEPRSACCVFGIELATLLQSLAPNWVPDAENPAFKEITANGTPLILWNDSGNDSTAADSALYYIGTHTATTASGARPPASTWRSMGRSACCA